MISILIKLPGMPAERKSIPNTLESLQNIVGGRIEASTICTDMVVISNEEGRLLGLKENCRVAGRDFCGPIILAGIDGDEFADLKPIVPGIWIQEAE